MRSLTAKSTCALTTAAALWLLAVASPLSAQEVTAAINGTVTDTSGAAISGAKVTATDLDRDTAFPTLTAADGSYELPRLPIGRYDVRVENPGFQSMVKSNITLVLNQTAQINFQLQVGNVNQTVNVTEAPPLLETESTEVGTVIGSHAIVSLPLETRNYNQLALLTPGAVTTSPASFNTGQATFNSGRPYINGNREQATYYLLDGMENIEFVDNNVAFSPNVDAIQEFNLITNNPSAEFGQFMGGVISVSMKSGTNQFHGDLFEFIRNDKLNANEWSNNFTNLPRPLLRWNEFGGTFGGPVVRNKLFFFVDYQGSRFDTPPSPTTITTFSKLEQSQPGNFSDVPGIALVYPGTTTPIPGNNLNNANKCGSAQQMQLNATAAAPCVFISPLALKLLAAFPSASMAGSNNGTLNNAINVQHVYTNGDQGDAKIDWAPTDKDHVFGRYSQQYVTQPTTNSQALLYNSSGNNIFPLYQGVLDWTHTFGPTFVNEARTGVNYFPAEGNVQGATSTNFASIIPGEPTAFLPGMYFAGAPVGGSQNGPFAFGTVSAPEIFHQTSIQA
ncbi:MAG: carboxypeptidase regulatory-like domain-containing protein, partial [Acidobacteriaceae bacterium]|nr:carboxypeptidase regulatory-like domain-containing protein [Acidobacteriaceae bacterium]